MKRLTAFYLIFVLLVGCFSGCGAQMQKFQYQFFDTFDTIVQIVGYTSTQQEFDAFAQMAHKRFAELHNLFDKFDDHGQNDGIAAVNANAGIAPVRVDPQVMELVLFALEWQQKTTGAVDITMGAVISVWQDYIARYGMADADARIPSQTELEQAKKLCGLHLLEVDEQAGTIYLKEKGASLDVGAVAKGYATEIGATELQKAGWKSFSISSGGNVRVCGKPQNGSSHWNIGIQDPASGAVLAGQSNLLDVVQLVDGSAVTSGDYQRFYMVDGRRMHHIIDPATLMPADHYRSVTVVTPHSGQADLFSTALFVMDPQTGKDFAQQHNLGVMWVMQDGSVVCNDILRPMLRNGGSYLE
ncbi:MAG: FAD:protein FMN transferase [Oscillospiraceae bacterium]|nr:FAD:protein FMN transferase [Oscillospiraceae bacterium]